MWLNIEEKKLNITSCFVLILLAYFWLSLSNDRDDIPKHLLASNKNGTHKCRSEKLLWYKNGGIHQVEEQQETARNSGRSIDKLYTQMGKVDRLRNRFEPFAALFLALGIVLANGGPCPPPGITAPPYTKHVFIWSWLLQFSTKTRWSPSLFLSRYIMY